MNWEQEQKLKAMGAQQQATESTLYGSIGAKGLDEPRRPSLRERVAMDLHRAERESNKAMRLRELSELLDRNSEVARILDLIEEAR